MVIAKNSDENQNDPMEKESNTGDKWDNIPPSSFLHRFKPEIIQKLQEADKVLPWKLVNLFGGNSETLI